MKFFLKTVCAVCAAVFLFLSGCADHRKSTDFTGLMNSFSLQTEAVYRQTKYSFVLTRTVRSIYRMDFAQTELFDEFSVFVNGEEITLEYDGISRCVTSSQLPQTGIITALTCAVDAADLSQTAQYDAQRDIYLITDTVAFGEFTLTVCAQTMLPLELRVPAIDLTAVFKK